MSEWEKMTAEEIIADLNLTFSGAAVEFREVVTANPVDTILISRETYEQLLRWRNADRKRANRRKRRNRIRRGHR